MNAEQAKQLKELQIDNGRLNKLVAEQALDKPILEAERDRRGSVKGGENGEPGAPQPFPNSPESVASAVREGSADPAGPPSSAARWPAPSIPAARYTPRLPPLNRLHQPVEIQSPKVYPHRQR